MISPEPDWAVALKVGVLEHVTVWVVHEVEYDQVQVDLVFAVSILSHQSVATYGRMSSSGEKGQVFLADQSHSSFYTCDNRE